MIATTIDVFGTMLVNAQLLRDHNKGGGYYLSHALKNDKPRQIILADFVVPKLRSHKTEQTRRHSYAVAALQSGDDVKTVQENLGHHTAAFALDVYGHVTDRMKRDSAARMDTFIKDAQGYKNL